MVSHSKKINFLQDKPLSILVRLCLPLILVNLIQIFTTMLTNSIYSNYVGETLFTVIGYLSTVTETYMYLTYSVMSAAWIKMAHSFALSDRQTAQDKTIQAIYSILLVVLVGMLLILLFRDPILHIFHVPAEYYGPTRQYFTVWLCGYTLMPLAQLFLLILNGTSGPGRILLANLLTVAITAVNAVVLLVILKLGLVGAALLPLCNGGLQLTLYLLLFRKDGFMTRFRRASFLPQWETIWSTIRYGLLIALQAVLCTVGYLITGLQANRYLSAAYISVLNVSIPITGVMDSIAQGCAAFYPQNYGAGLADRVRKFFILTNTIVFFYGTLCCAIYMIAARPYYSQLFSDPAIVALGTEYWFWYGIGFIPLGFVYTVRYFFDSVGLGRISLLSGLGELLGHLLCAFWLIPVYGNIGRSLAYPIGWALGPIFLTIAYLCLHKKIYRKCAEYAQPVA